ncbi:MAG: fasciclin domain-containing protein [Alphaproteobacteria bacterium]|nr:fasciclin domain-containing protein [Alphaproteobacteria bacterium]
MRSLRVVALAAAFTMPFAVVSLPAHADMHAAATPTVVGVAAANEDFSTLVAAVKAAGLVDTLNGDGPFTVFAPTNAAFAALPEGTLETLLKPENKDQLVSILTYHVVPGAVMAADLAGTTSNVATVQGATVKVDGTTGVKVNDATVTTADIKASNGVIHVIDKVILPPQ